MSDFIDHGTDISNSVKVIIRKDDFVPSKPWFADVVFPDGHKWIGWQQFIHSRKDLLENIRAAAPHAEIVNEPRQ